MAAAAADGGDLRERIVAAARGWLGTPYRHQASMRGAGCDCLGLIRGVWREVIGPEPEQIAPYDASWLGADTEDRFMAGLRTHFLERAVRPIRAGAVLLFRMGPGRRVRHAGIACGSGTVIHALSGLSVHEQTLEPFWGNRLAAQFDFPGTDEPWQP